MAACSDGLGPTPVEPSTTIIMPGNTANCTIDFSSCFARVDQKFKDLYEQNNTYSRTGEALYRDASNANHELARIFLAPERSVAEAIRALDRFTAEIQRSLRAGDYSACAASELLALASFVRAKLVANDSDMTGAPSLDHCVSPVTVTAIGSTTNGVVLTINDPFHYTQDPYNEGTFHTNVYFQIQLPGGAIVTTATAEQFGPVTFTFAHDNKAPGTYTYLVRQCDAVSFIGCSAWTPVVVTITEAGICPHDNRNGLKDVVDKTKPKCEKDGKAG